MVPMAARSLLKRHITTQPCRLLFALTGTILVSNLVCGS